MTADEFRSLALELPETIESAHMDHPDFRVSGKIFATLGPKEAWGMVKLTPEQQKSLVAAAPQVFQPCAGAWGRRGSTQVRLEAASALLVQQALFTAWLNTAPKQLAKQYSAWPAEADSAMSKPAAQRSPSKRGRQSRA
jgi:hypothetical protein